MTAATCTFPDTVEEKNLQYLRKEVPLSIERADIVMTVSETVGLDLSELYGLPAKKVVTVHPGISQAFQPSPLTDAVRQLYGLPRDYFLAVGTVEPRKNYDFLLRVLEKGNFAGDLVIVGSLGVEVRVLFPKTRTLEKS